MWETNRIINLINLSKRRQLLLHEIYDCLRFLFKILVTLVTAGSCPNGWVARPGGSCYLFSTSTMVDWDTAQGQCLRRGAHLANLDTQEEIVWMKGFRLTHGLSKLIDWFYSITYTVCGVAKNRLQYFANIQRKNLAWYADLNHTHRK